MTIVLNGMIGLTKYSRDYAFGRTAEGKIVDRARNRVDDGRIESFGRRICEKDIRGAFEEGRFWCWGSGTVV